MTHNKKIIITSGGTGGHIIPARCLASQLAKENNDVLFLGDVKYANYIQADDPFKSAIIYSSQICNKPLTLITAAVKIGLGTLQSLAKIILHRPKTVVSFGGYATFPVLIAAVITRRRIILHEQNSHLGKVNRIFAKYANKIALSFKDTSGIAPQNQHKTTFVGNLVRDEILALNSLPYTIPEEQKPVNKPQKPDNKMGYDVLLASDFKDLEREEENTPRNLFNILVIGGSGGAQIFSDVLPKAFFNLTDGFKGGINIMQQCRAELARDTFEQYRSFNLNCEVQPFFSDMPERIKKAHLVISRSGSSSIFEFCAAKKPMILIPFEKSADNHQAKNADFLGQKGAAVVIREKDFTISNIGDILKNLIDNPLLLKRMSNTASSLAIMDANEKLARLVQHD